MTAAGVALGLAIRALIFAFMRVLAALWFDYQIRVEPGSRNLSH
jgi:hypothetical protein